jgi:alpha/beta superfamily hydrolase
MAEALPGGVRLQSHIIPGPAGAIEALLQSEPGRAHSIAVLLCHPHPLGGGTMHNKVVHRAASTFVEMGAAVLRFNFRGVGNSEGTHDNGRGELDDARTAWQWMAERHPDARPWVAGFSFGSWVAAHLGTFEQTCERMVLIAPPVKSRDFSVLDRSPVPKHVVQGTADDLCVVSDLEAVYPGWAEPKRVVWIPGATHFFDKQLNELANALREVLSGVVQTAS